MSKGLDALKELKFQIGSITAYSHDLKELPYKVKDLGFFETIEKELKALEIIKKRFTIQFCKSDLSSYYGIMQIGINPIYIKTQEEFDLLKEVLL